MRKIGALLTAAFLTGAALLSIGQAAAGSSEEATVSHVAGWEW